MQSYAICVNEFYIFYIWEQWMKFMHLSNSCICSKLFFKRIEKPNAKFINRLLTRIVITSKVTFIRPVSKNIDRSVIFKPICGDHSPTLTNDCCFNFTKSNLNSMRRPSLNSMDPDKPFHSTCTCIQWMRNKTETRILRKIVFTSNGIVRLTVVACSSVFFFFFFVFYDFHVRTYKHPPFAHSTVNSAKCRRKKEKKRKQRMYLQRLCN